MPNKERLTQVQRETLDLITKFTIKNGYTPNFTDLAKMRNVGAQNARANMETLELKGHLEIVKANGKLRTIFLTGWKYMKKEKKNDTK
jgi:hypothetical protein